MVQSNLKAGVRRGKEEYKNKIQAQFKTIQNKRGVALNQYSAATSQTNVAV